MSFFDYFRLRNGNGHAPSQASLNEAVAASVSALLDERLARMTEAWGDWVDPRDAFRDSLNGETWFALGGGKSEEDRSKTPSQWSQQTLNEARQQCRLLAAENEYAVNAHHNRINYLVGWGHEYSVLSADKDDERADLCENVQAVIDEWTKAEHWGCRQAEIVLRCDRDGECFLRFFDGPDGLRLRFIEPAQVYCPQQRAHRPECSWGIETEPDDVETVVNYWIDEQPIPATEVQHRKRNVDSNVKRGQPLLWPVRRQLRRLRQVNDNMAVGSAIQTQIGMVTEIAGASKSALEDYRSARAVQQTTQNALTGRTDYYSETRPKEVINNDKVTRSFPFSNTRYDGFVTVAQHFLRGIAAMLVMPEFMFTSDASNANYSSTMVAEGPAVRQFERQQYQLVEEDKAVMERVIAWGIEYRGLPADTLELVKIECEPPSLAVRDKLQETQVREAESRNGILSVQTWSMLAGYDYDDEQAKIEGHKERQPDVMLPGLDDATGPDGRPLSGVMPPQLANSAAAAAAAAAGRVKQQGDDANQDD